MAGKRASAKKKPVLSKSAAAKKARSGADMGKPGKGFAKGVSQMEARGMPAANAKRIMGAQFQKMRRKGML